MCDMNDMFDMQNDELARNTTPIYADTISDMMNDMRNDMIRRN